MKQFAEIQREIVTKIREIKETDNRFLISFDKSKSTRNRRFINLNLHFPVGLQSLGLTRVKGSMVTERAIELEQERLHEYALSLNDDIVSTLTDGASIMIKFGRETESLQFSYFAHATHLSVCYVLYTEKPKQISDKCRDGGGTGNATANDKGDGEENAEEKSDEQECDEEQQNCFDIIPEIKEIVKKLRKIVKIFRMSPVKNDENLQPQVQQSFGKKKSLFLDCKTRQNSLLNMLQRFYEMRKVVKVAMFQLDKDFNISSEELDKIKEICDILYPLEMTVQYLCKENADLILSEKVIVFAIKKLSDLKTPFGNASLKSFKKPIQEQSNVEVVHLLEYLKSPNFLEQSYDEFGIKIRKNKIRNLATKLQQRVFKQQVITDTVNETMESPSDSNVNNDGNDEASLPKNVTLSEEFQAFLKEPRLKIEEVQSDGARIINKEMQLFEATKKRPENLENLHRSFFTIKPTSVEAERTFSAMVLFATKIRNSPNNDTLKRHDCNAPILHKIKVLQSTPVNRTPFNRTPSPSNANCQGTEFLHCNVLCFTSIIGQPRYPTMTAKF